MASGTVFLPSISHLKMDHGQEVAENLFKDFLLQRKFIEDEKIENFSLSVLSKPWHVFSEETDKVNLEVVAIFKSEEKMKFLKDNISREDQLAILTKFTAQRVDQAFSTTLETMVMPLTTKKVKKIQFDFFANLKTNLTTLEAYYGVSVYFP